MRRVKLNTTVGTYACATKFSGFDVNAQRQCGFANLFVADAVILTIQLKFG
ncbi:MAG TPA: hypothetical protein VGD40_25120 [Chryseosolibacter sp.]